MSRPGLKEHLDRLAAAYDHRFLDTDPLGLVRGYDEPPDREVAGLVASSLAYGNVRAIRAAVSGALLRLGTSPAAVLDGLSARDLRLRCRGFRHRFTSGRDLAALFWTIREMRRAHGSIGAFFLAGDLPGAPTIREALESFVDRALARDLSGFYRKSAGAGEGIRFLLPSPRNGSACKRLNLYLRWMVRRDDGLDLGIWRDVDPSRLMVPVDTHVARIASHMGLTERKSPGWEMAEEITASLRELDPRDPVRYDFALSRLGILDACPRRRSAARCARCPLHPVCLL